MKNIDYKFFKDNNLPHFAYEIYHYTSPAGLLGILESNSLHFTNSYFLNDKAEIIYTYNLLLELLPTIQKDIDKDLFENIVERAKYVTSNDFYNRECEVLFREDFYIMSFSHDSDNLALWNNYTKSLDKTGYNIKFRAETLINKLKEQLPDDTYIASSVVCYDERKQLDALRDLILYYNKACIEDIKNKDEYIKCVVYELIVYSLFFKHPKFEFEKEYRIIISNIAHLEDKNLEFRINNGMYIPYLICKLPEDKSNDNKIIEEIKVSPIHDKELINYSVRKVLNKTENLFTPIRFSEIPLRY